MPEHGQAASDRGFDATEAGADLSALYEHHGPTVRGLCRLLLRNGHEAEDAAQQTFLSAYRSMLSGNSPRHPAAWLATIARNECVSRIQRRMREPLAVPDTEEELPDPVSVAAERADLAELWRAIGELPERQRQALLLREFSGLSYSELADALAVSEPAVESLLFRARDALRVRLQPVFGSLASVVPIVALRNLFERVAGGASDPGAYGGLARIAGAPAMAKVVVGAAAIAAAGGAVVVIEPHTGAQVQAPPDRVALSDHSEPPAPVVPARALPEPAHPRESPAVRAPSAPRPPVFHPDAAAPAPARDPNPPAPAVFTWPVSRPPTASPGLPIAETAPTAVPDGGLVSPPEPPSPDVAPPPTDGSSAPVGPTEETGPVAPVASDVTEPVGPAAGDGASSDSAGSEPVTLAGGEAQDRSASEEQRAGDAGHGFASEGSGGKD
jgi:RNA polymerase sigma-70 factor (ECF subfamily)